MPTTYSDLICEGPCGVIWRPRPPRGWQNTKSDASPARVPLSSAQPTGPLCGEGLLDAVTDAMVALHLRYYCRVPPPPRPTCSATTCWRARSAGSTRRSRRRCSSCNARPTCTRPARSSRPPPEVRRRRRAALRPPGRRLHLQLPRSVGPDLAVELFLLEAPGAGHSPDGVTAWSRPNPVAPTAMG